MYRLIIDYNNKTSIGDHWYGNHDNVIMPYISNSGVQLYNVISLNCDNLPIKIKNPIRRLYLPHYFTSNIAAEDLFFEYLPNEVRLLNDLTVGNIEVFDDFFDHFPRNVTFTPLRDYENPGSSNFNEEKLIYPHHQLGGTPYFKQPGGHKLSCIKCMNMMGFLLQFDNDDFLDADFEDDGAAYYWWCPKCQTIGCRVESS